ncbi:MAG TPA: hypothetical protein VMS95_07470 [Candidatus Krumholzibacteriaceae bacterium]|nr:hypothetical protein [Candidatus Krumholzibacteriaceae bacterium]
MPEVTIDTNELRSKSGNKAVEDLVTFLKEQLKTDVETSGNTLSISTEKHTRPYIRTVLRKFLHRVELKEDFRVIAGKECSFIIKERKITKEE